MMCFYKKIIIYCLILALLFNISQQASINNRILQESQTPQSDPETAEDRIKNQILDYMSQKQVIVAQRDIILSQIQTAITDIYDLRPSLHQPKIDAETAYTNYYNEKIKCEGYTSKLDIIGRNSQVTYEECLQAPIAIQAANLYLQKGQLAGYQSDVAVTGKIVDAQQGFVTDLQTEQPVYQDLSTYLANKNQTLSYKFSNQAYNTQNTLYQESQIGVMKQQSLTAANQAYNLTSQNIQASQGQLSSLITTCTANVQSLKATLDQKLSAINAIYTQIADKQQIIHDGFYQLSTKLNLLQQLTNQMNYVAYTYAQLYPTPEV